MPDLRYFNRSAHLGRPFARCDYLKQLPTLAFCNNILSLFDSCRKQGLKLNKCNLDDEKRAYLAVKEGKHCG